MSVVGVFFRSHPQQTRRWRKWGAASPLADDDDAAGTAAAGAAAPGGGGGVACPPSSSDGARSATATDDDDASGDTTTTPTPVAAAGAAPAPAADAVAGILLSAQGGRGRGPGGGGGGGSGTSGSSPVVSAAGSGDGGGVGRGLSADDGSELPPLSSLTEEDSTEEGAGGGGGGGSSGGRSGGAPPRRKSSKRLPQPSRTSLAKFPFSVGRRSRIIESASSSVADLPPRAVVHPAAGRYGSTVDLQSTAAAAAAAGSTGTFGGGGGAGGGRTPRTGGGRGGGTRGARKSATRGGRRLSFGGSAPVLAVYKARPLGDFLDGPEVDEDIHIFGGVDVSDDRSRAAVASAAPYPSARRGAGDGYPALAPSLAAPGIPPVTFRHGHVGGVRLSGWVSKPGRRVAAKSHRRFLELVDGVLHNRRDPDSAPTWQVEMVDASVSAGPGDRELTLHVDGGRTTVLIADTLSSRRSWLGALSAATARVGDFYQFGKQIGSGAYSQVLLGRDKIQNTLVAIKVLEKPPGDPDRLELIRREVDVVKRVAHRGVVRIFDVFESREKTYVVMEYMAGGELLDVITEQERLSERNARHVIRELLLVVEYLHSRNIVHRDIKPENILCDGRSWPLRIKLTDFGLSRELSNSGDECMRSHCGTAYYLAKEVFDGNGYGKPVDLWAVGIVLFVILSGRFCFFGDTDERFMRRLRAGVRFPESEWGTISEGARSLIRGLLRPDPATRLTASQALRHPPLPPMPEESMSLRLGQYMPPSLDAERTIAGFAVNVPPAKWRGAGGAVRTD
ncbi:hypothetical protein I4F81_006616 [Pyropia yezoensis]|uniref:Uncharacterized protein n=1 Tax=Pyropia yezoensis TaxID=2788 RepID=A0ACC3C2S7_PYRYE|nr:hypothetical protein I4F81_006616 [Neopyropia yezoensis]